IFYWLLMSFVPVPGLGAPSLAVPGNNLAHFIDQRFLPGQKFEGTILSTMAAVANCLLGVFAGLLLQNERIPGQKKFLWLAGGGLLSLVVGLVWSLHFPIIKLLWTSSYVLVACGCGAILLGIFYQIIEIWHIQKWSRPFVWIGMNAITLYLVANMISFQQLSKRFVGGNIKLALGVYGDLIQAFVGTLLIVWLANF